MAIAHTLKSCLEHERVPYELIAHRHTATSLRSAETAHIDADDLAKAVLLEEDLEHSHYVMAVLPASYRLVLPGRAGNRPPGASRDRGGRRGLFGDSKPAPSPPSDRFTGSRRSSTTA
jgi:Ala-tRNA(Pro) deacylase